MVAVLSALPAEIRATVDAIEKPVECPFAGRKIVRGLLSGNDVVVGSTGVGKVLAAMTVQGVIDRYHPDALVYAGIAGALNQSYKIGDVVIAADCVQHDFDVTPFGFPIGTIPHEKITDLTADPVLMSYVLRREVEGRNLYTGRILSGDRFVTSAGDPNDALREGLKGDAVDMESAAAALVAHVNGVPFVAVRVISDMADGVVPDNFKAFIRETSLFIRDFAAYIGGFCVTESDP